MTGAAAHPQQDARHWQRIRSRRILKVAISDVTQIVAIIATAVGFLPASAGTGSAFRQEQATYRTRLKVAEGNRARSEAEGP